MNSLSNRYYSALIAGILISGLAGCSDTPDAGPDSSAVFSPGAMADALYAVIESDRTVYSRNVVDRLQDEEKVIHSSEHWQDEKALPLPIQMLRMGAELTAQKTDAFSYSLMSKWPINEKNAPKTDAESTGLDMIANDPSKPFYSKETADGAEYFSAYYADIAITPACVTCHNNHKDSPRHDFKLGDVMGGVVIRMPLNRME